MSRPWMRCLLLTVWPLTGCIIADEPNLALEASLLGTTQVIHRGMVNNEHGAIRGQGILDLDARFGGTFTADVLGNMDVSNDTGDAWFPDGQGGKFTQIDYIGQYSRAVGPVGVAAGVLHYVLPDGDRFPVAGPRASSTELFGAVSGELLGFGGVLAVNGDIDEADGVYVNGEVSRGFDITNRIRTNFAVSLGYMTDRQADWTYGLKEAGLTDLQGHGDVEFAFDDRTTLFVGVFGSTIIDDDLRDWFDLIDIEKDNVWVTFGVRWTL